MLNSDRGDVPAQVSFTFETIAAGENETVRTPPPAKIPCPPFKDSLNWGSTWRFSCHPAQLLCCAGRTFQSWTHTHAYRNPRVTT